MSAPLWVVEAAEAFWDSAGEVEPFPRNLRRPIARGLPLAVVSLPRLRIASVEEWLRGGAVLCRIGNDRPLRACLIARFGQGIVFVDGADPEDEQRLSIAHELGHFLRDYWGPRRVAVERLGPQVLGVLDGMRPADEAERTHALLAGVELGLLVHLMERSEGGEPADARILAAETDADRLAFELLAPFDQVTRDLESRPAEGRLDAAEGLLVDAYGFPPYQAAHYARLLVREREPSDSLLRRLGLLP